VLVGATPHRCYGHWPRGARLATLYPADLRGAGQGNVEDQLERKLYVVRKRAENEVAASSLPDKSFFYIPSLFRAHHRL